MLEIRLRNQTDSAHGQSLVELALVIHVLMITTLGAIEFGRGLHAAMTMTNAARDAARVGGSTAATIDQAKAAAIASAAPLAITTDDIEISRTATEIEVTVSYSFTTIVPMVSEIWGGGALDIERSAIGRMDPP